MPFTVTWRFVDCRVFDTATAPINVTGHSILDAAGNAAGE